MRVLLATFGSLGDLHPGIAVGQALQRHGAIARIAAAAEYRDTILAAGLEYAHLRPDFAAFGPPQQLAQRLFEDPLRGAERMIRDCVMPFVREAHADLAAAARDADLLVSHPLTHTLRVVAEQQHKPWVSTVLAPMGFVSRFDPPTVAGFDVLRLAQRLGPWAWWLAMGTSRRLIRKWETPLRQFLREQGVPPSDRVETYEGQFSPSGTLALFDAVLGTPQPDWPRGVQLCGAALHDGRAVDAATQARLQDFLAAGDAPLVFGLGSAAVLAAQDFWPQAIEAAQRLGRRALLLTGGRGLAALPPGCIAFDYLPYSQVFPHAAAVVHQAGIGTLSQALRAGRPQLITPVGFDQPDNARRAAALGVARVLPFQRARAALMAEELDRLLRDPAAALAATDVARQLQGVDGAGVAAQYLLAAV